MPTSNGQRRTDADGLNAVVDAMKDKVQAPGSKPLRLQRLAKLDDKFACVAGDCFSRRDRFSKGASNLYKVRRPHRIDRLTDPSQGLIEAAARFGTEAQGERRAGCGRQFTDDCKTEDAKAVDHILRQAQGADRQIQYRFRALARWNDDGRTRGKTRQRMSGAPAAGEGGAGGDAGGGDPLDHPLQHGVFSAVKMRRASDIDDDPVVLVGGDDRRIVLQPRPRH